PGGEPSADPRRRWPRGAAVFPYTTLFRSLFDGGGIVGVEHEPARVGDNSLTAQLDRRCNVGDLLDADDKLHSGCRSNARYGSSIDRKSTRLNSSHVKTSYAVFCLKKKLNA